MTDHDIELVRESFAHLHRRKVETAAMFYGRLFEIAPEVRPLFTKEIAEQSAKLMETLTVAMAALRDPEGLTALLRKLGRNHRSYGVEERHYASVEAALIWTLRASLGRGFTPQLERAWTSVYRHMAGIMIAAGRAG
ncbi:MAG TPA: globin domain-containing protein [Bosea sp. (in: a-proteobacteria)]|jgi:hemoglobin-like flavoprotein|uniref:globin domain-containing protein n=1 Tax=Bosea sp. (in: a-proteobacteria) TaxID=1871050 RepID=UPI002E144DB0|nr:globin domain-containing protein [Bosea sp. (in: a-proteobacteria)]